MNWISGDKESQKGQQGREETARRDGRRWVEVGKKKKKSEMK
jgi:hypothetical protein